MSRKGTRGEVGAPGPAVGVGKKLELEREERREPRAIEVLNTLLSGPSRTTYRVSGSVL